MGLLVVLALLAASSPSPSPSPSPVTTGLSPVGATAPPAAHGPVRFTAGTVLIGVAPLSAAQTAMHALTVEGGIVRSRTVGHVDHRAGFVPVGAIADDRHLVLSVQDGATRDARVVVVDAAGRQRTVLHEAVPGQAPLAGVVDGRPTAIVVREFAPTPAGSTFDVVRLALEEDDTMLEVLASRRALWVTPVRGTLVPPLLLVKDGVDPGTPDGSDDGAAHIDRLDDGVWHAAISLPRAPVRSPVALVDQVDVDVAVEVDDSVGRPGRASLQLFEPGDKRASSTPLVVGRSGLSPVVAGTVLAVGTGRKDGSLLVGRLPAAETAPAGTAVAGTAAPLQFVPRSVGRAGVARPQAVTAAGDVVVWLDRGAAWPGELWWLPAAPSSKAVPLWPAVARTAIAVYGVVPTLGGDNGGPW
jgi:hypothetical protein